MDETEHDIVNDDPALDETDGTFPAAGAWALLVSVVAGTFETSGIARADARARTP